MRKEIYPLINTWAIREPEDLWPLFAVVGSCQEHRMAWLPPPEHIQKELDAQRTVGWARLPEVDARTPKRVSLVSGRGSKLLPAEGLARSSVEGGQIVLQRKETLAYRSPRRHRKQEDPDPAFLDMIGMTKEDYLAKDLELRAEAENDDAALVVVEEEEEEEEEDLTLPFGTFGGKQVRPRTTLHGNHIPVPVREVPKVVLEEDALERVEAAVASGQMVDIDARQFAPTKPVWELPREGQGKTFWEPLPEEKKKEG